MIIGIDETGNFAPNSNEKHFFVAAVVDQNLDKYQLKKKLFLEWESTIPERNRDQKNGEVKGRNLTPSQIHDFFYGVFLKPPRSYFTVVEFSAQDNPNGLVEKHKNWNLSQMENASLQRTQAGHLNWAKRYQELITWYKKSNYERVVKIELLQNLYCYAVQQALYYGQVFFFLDNHKDQNFDFRFKIDKDFVRSDLLRNFWDIYVYKFWENFAKSNPTPLVSNKPELMEALNKYFEVRDNHLILCDTFYDHTLFTDSKEHFEIRMSDILGNILHRYHNKGQCQQIWLDLNQIIALERNVPLYIKARFRQGEPPS